MSDHSESGQASLGKLTSEFAFGNAPPVPDYETVVNPERRAARDAGPNSQIGSSMWRQLFPTAAEPSEPIDEPAGFELGHFTVEKRIGVGGMGSVFRALDQRLNRIVALKVLSPAQSRDRDAVQRFRNEARAAAQLDHDNIARVYYVGEDKDLQFIAYEYVRGTNLRDLIRQSKQLDPAEAINYTLQVAAALNHTSAAGVIHRDIKPSNIIVTPNGRAKLVDLGLARKQHGELSGDLTLAGTTLGTFDYISPEQAKDPRNVDVRSDIYSLGCTLYHMLAGEPPYPEGTMLQKLLDHQGADPPDPAIKNRRVPPNLSAVVKKMMASDLRRRYANPDELIRDLMLVAGSLGLGTLSPEGLVWMPRPRRPSIVRRNAAWLATAAVLLVTVVLLDSWGTGTGETTDANPGSSAEDLENPIPFEDVARQRSEPVPLERQSPAADIPSPTTNVVTATSPQQPTESVPLPGTDDRSDNVTEPAFSPDVPDGGFFTQLSELLFKTAPADLENAFPRPEFAPSIAETTEAIEDTEPVHAPIPEPRSVAFLDQANATFPGTVSPSEDLKPSQPFVVLAEGSVPKEYPTLEAACRDARDGSTIDLRYDGPRPGGSEKPISLANKRLVIKAGRDASGHVYRPVILFDPGDAASADDASLFSLTQSSLELVGVDVEFTVRQTGARAALFSLQAARRVELRSVRVRFINPDDQPAAVFAFNTGPGGNMAQANMMNVTPPGTASAPSGADVDLDECFIRGACDLFAMPQAVSAVIRVQQTLTAVRGSLLSVAGHKDMPATPSVIDLRFEEVTAVTGGGLLELRQDELQPTYRVAVTAQDSVFAVEDPSKPLIRTQGNGTIEELRNLLQWKGQRNYYDGVELVSALSGTMAGDSQTDQFDEWKVAKESQARNAGLAWNEAWRGQDFAELTPAQLQLSSDADDLPDGRMSDEIPGADPVLFGADGD